MIEFNGSRFDTLQMSVSEGALSASSSQRPTELERLRALDWGHRLTIAARAHWRAGWRNYFVGALAGLFLAITGAFGTQAASPINRLLFWILVLIGGSACAIPIERFTSRRPAVGDNHALKWLVITGAIAAPMALFSWMLARILFGDATGEIFFWYFGWAALVISGTMTALMMALNTPGVATAAAPVDRPAPQVRFRERLEAPLRSAEIYAIAAEDHYLRVHTSAGSTLLLMRLSDAIAELEGIEGAQVHRSWWVARHAIEGVRRDGRRTILTLKSGVIAPVSRPNVAAIRSAGWI